MFSYIRSLHPDDYPLLQPYVEWIKAFEHDLANRGIFYRKDHEHRTWEYAMAIKAFVELCVGTPANQVTVLDTGSGICALPLFLRKTYGAQVTVNDSGAYGEVREVLAAQCLALGIDLPLNTDPVEALTLPDNTFDLTMCISVIEHVTSTEYQHALMQLYRVTKPGGYLYITSDFFRDHQQWEVSPYRFCQHNLFMAADAFGPSNVLSIPAVIPVLPVGGPPQLEYRGDFVHNYSFMASLWQKPITA